MRTVPKLLIATLLVCLMLGHAHAKLKAVVLEFQDDRQGAAKLVWSEIEKAQEAHEFKALKFSKRDGFIFFLSPEFGYKKGLEKLAELGADVLVFGKIEGNITIVGISWKGHITSGPAAFAHVPLVQFLYFFKDHSLDKKIDVLLLALKALDRFLAGDYESARTLFDELYKAAGDDFTLNELALLKGYSWLERYRQTLDDEDFEAARRSLLAPFKEFKERTNPLLAGSLKATLAYLYLLKSACDPNSTELKSSAEALLKHAKTLFELAGAAELPAEADRLIKSPPDCPKQPERTERTQTL